MRSVLAGGVAAILLVSASAAEAAAVLKAQYLFQNSLASNIAGAPDLVSVDPAGLNSFVADAVNGETRTVFKTGGATAKARQGGLSFDSTGLLSPTEYSVALTLKFNDGDRRWRRILDTSNRGYDGGLYVNPQNDLEVYPGRGAGTNFIAGDYRNVVLTVSPGDAGGFSHVSAYIDGGASLGLVTSVMDISMTGIMNLFLDDGSEWASASIAALSFYDGVLSSEEIARINGDPIPDPGPGAVPEPASWAMMVAGFGAVGMMARRRRGAAVRAGAA